MKQEDLIEKIEEKLRLENELKEIEAIVVPPFVTKPIVCKASEWNSYIEKKSEYDKAVELKSSGKDSVERDITNLKIEIIQMLPASNIWFVTDDEKYAVGHQSDNWPGSNGNLFIKVNPIRSELKEIHHQNIN